MTNEMTNEPAVTYAEIITAHLGPFTVATTVVTDRHRPPFCESVVFQGMTPVVMLSATAAEAMTNHADALAKAVELMAKDNPGQDPVDTMIMHAKKTGIA